MLSIHKKIRRRFTHEWRRDAGRSWRAPAWAGRCGARPAAARRQPAAGPAPTSPPPRQPRCCSPPPSRSSCGRRRQAVGQEGARAGHAPDQPGSSTTAAEGRMWLHHTAPYALRAGRVCPPQPSHGAPCAGGPATRAALASTARGTSLVPGRRSSTQRACLARWMRFPPSPPFRGLGIAGGRVRFYPIDGTVRRSRSRCNWPINIALSAHICTRSEPAPPLPARAPRLPPSPRAAPPSCPAPRAPRASRPACCCC